MKPSRRSLGPASTAAAASFINHEERGHVMPVLIDKVAWIRLEDGSVLSTRSRGKDTYYSSSTT
ncbi:hypothetical protein ACWDR9_37760 [Streptosporangium sandarakinum]